MPGFDLAGHRANSGPQEPEAACQVRGTQADPINALELAAHILTFATYRARIVAGGIGDYPPPRL